MKKIILLIFSISSIYSSILAQENSYAFNIDEAVNYALANNYTVRTAKLDIDAAEKKKWETTTIGLPQINGKVDYQNWIKQGITLIPSEIFGGPPGEFEEVTFGAKQNLNATVTISQLLFDGSYLIGLQSAKTYLKISELAKEKTDQKIREAVINAYGSVLLVQESILILQKNREVLQKNLNETKAILSNGLAEEQDLQQQQITLSTIENELNKSKRLEIILKKMFNLTLGIPIDTQVVLKENLDNLALSSTNMNLINSNFDLDNHIDYRIADNTVMSNELLVKFEKSKALPSLGAFINYSTYANNDNNIFFKNNGNWFDSSLFGVSLNVPIFSSLQRSARTQQAKINLEQSEIELDETSQRLKLQVDTAKNKYQFALDHYQTSKQNLVLAESIAKKEQIKFFEGLSSSFNLTNAQNQLYQQQQQYIQSILEIIQSKVELENALNIF
ncbi:MAG: TolC family protein [Bacteroidota bacterium]